MWITIDEVKNFTGIEARNFKFSKDDGSKLDEMLISWIQQATSLIKSYTNNSFSDDPDDAVKNICLRLVSNMVSLAIAKRDSPLIKVNDWNVKLTSSSIFTNDLKADLEPYVIDKSSVSDSIDFFCISGD